MSPAPGSRLGPYEITAKLGEGGMGEVWRATDTTLRREVAIKVLPSAFTEDKERLARFEREAQLLAQLNHPNIAQIYGLEKSGETRALVMELVPGPTLAERLEAGPLPFAESLSVALQITQALEEAHDKGIVHRDLKPQNIKASSEGRVKVLDFGLAKAMDSVAGAASAADLARSPTMMNSPTLTAMHGTQLGVILGTAAYMSPEQARGRTVDRRADIWSFGAILYEMLAGKPLFDGETVGDTLAAVLKSPLDWSALPAATPAGLRRLLERCLERDPRQRLRDIGEARVTLSSGFAATPQGADAAAAPLGSRKARLPWILFAAAALAIAVLAIQLLRPARSVHPVVRKFTIDARLESGGNTRLFQISPDGARLVFQSKRGIELRELAEIEPRLLVPRTELGTGEAAATPFWSADGASIGYYALGSLWRIPAAGGAPATICKLPADWNGGVWMADDTIVFATTRGPIFRVRARGGDPEIFLPLDPKAELDFHHPSVLPDGRSLIYAVHRTAGVDTIEMFRDGKRSVVLRVDPGQINIQDSPQIVNVPFYSPTGHILFQRDQGNTGLWALPFSADRGSATGDPFLVAAEMGYPSVAGDGLLAYAGLSAIGSGQLMLLSRDGKLDRALGEARPGLAVGHFSADGRRLLFVAAERQVRDIFAWELDGERATRLTNSPEAEDDPVWISGTGRIGFSAPTESCRAVFAMNADGTGIRERLAEKSSQPWFAAGGGELVSSTVCQERRGIDRVVLRPAAITPLLDAPAGIDEPSLSPDGRFLAYRSWESGRPQRLVTSYPSLDGRWIVAQTEYPLRWSRDGKEIYYIDGPPFRMMTVPIALDPAFSTGAARALFELEPIGAAEAGGFDVTPDGQRFAMVRRTETSGNDQRIVVVENWFEEFRKP